MNRCASEWERPGEFLERNGLLLGAFLNKVFQNGEYLGGDANVVLVWLLPLWTLSPLLHPCSLALERDSSKLQPTAHVPARFIRPVFGKVKEIIQFLGLH